MFVTNSPAVVEENPMKHPLNATRAKKEPKIKFVPWEVTSRRDAEILKEWNKRLKELLTA